MRAAFVAVLLIGCTGDITAGDPPGDDDSGVDAPPATNAAVERALRWVAAQVPYCQAPNHAHDNDADCSSTCTRPDNAEWDPYRSDCSGLVSWAWALPPPGRTTATLAPFNTAVSEVIAAADLQPGDAINNDHHTMLFEAWVVPGEKATFIEEPGCSSSQPYAREVTAAVTLDGDSLTVQYRGAYTAIRQKP